MSSQPEHYRCNSHKCSITLCSLVVTRRDPTEPLQTEDAALHHIPVSIPIVVINHRTTAGLTFLEAIFARILSLGNEIADPTTAQELTTSRVTVALVQRHQIRTLPRTSPPRTLHPYRIQNGLQMFAVALLAFGKNEA